MSTTFKLENASSGRSKCRKCKGPIGKGELRIQKIIETPDGRTMVQNYLVGCIPIPKVYKDDVQAFMCDLVDSTEDMMLSNEEGTRQIYDTIMDGRAKAAAKKKSSKRATAADAGSEKKAQTMPEKLLRAKFTLELRTEEEEKEGIRPKKKAKTLSSKNEIGDSSNSLSPKDITDLDRAYADMLMLYQDKNLDELKDYLRWNQQVLKGTKPLSLMKCMDGHLNGRLSRCPLCHEGKLNLEVDDTVQCSGYFDEDTHQRFACNYASKAADAPRSKWYIEKPSEEEEEEMKKEASNPDTAASNSVAEQMVDALASFQFPLKNKAEIKSAAGVFLDMARRFNLNVSEDDKEAKRSIGPLILSNRTIDLSSLEFCSIMCDHFGVKKSGQQVEDQRKVVRSMCKCANNATLYEVMSELSQLYRKESNSNAANTYSKVAATIKNLPFEITEDNAMGLSKGKTKVAGIGKSSAEKMKEFLSTGSMQKLEEKRAAHAK